MGVNWSRMTADGQYKKVYRVKTSPAQIQLGDVMSSIGMVVEKWTMWGIYIGSEKHIEVHCVENKQ